MYIFVVERTILCITALLFISIFPKLIVIEIIKDILWIICILGNKKRSKLLLFS